MSVGGDGFAKTARRDMGDGSPRQHNPHTSRRVSKRRGRCELQFPFNRYWTYQRLTFPQVADYFERPFAPDGRPPVFVVQQAWHNVIPKPSATQEEISRLLNLLPSWKRHKWFRSMNSSQALAQSVLGNLAVYDKLDCLAELNDDEGEPLLGRARLSPGNFAWDLHPPTRPRGKMLVDRNRSFVLALRAAIARVVK